MPHAKDGSPGSVFNDIAMDSNISKDICTEDFLLMLLHTCLRLHILPPVLLPMTRRLITRLCVTNSFLLECFLLEPGKKILPNRLKLCACALLPLHLVVILAPTMVLVPMHTHANIVVPAKTPVLVLSKTRMADLLCSIRFLVCP